MEYKITNTRQVDETLFTEVEYVINGETVTVEVAHFMPKSKEEVLQNIVNRYSSEKVKLEAKAVIPTFLDELPINTTVSIS